MHGNVREADLGVAVDAELRAHAVAQLADVTDEGGAALDDVCGLQGRVDRADVGVAAAVVVDGGVVCYAAGGRGEVEGDVLFGHEAGADAGAEVVVEELCCLCGGDVAAALEEAAGEGGDCVCVCLDNFDEHFREGHLLGEGVWVRDGEGLHGSQRLLVVIVDAGHVRVGYDDEGEVAQGHDTPAEADGQEFAGEAGGG